MIGSVTTIPATRLGLILSSNTPVTRRPPIEASPAEPAISAACVRVISNEVRMGIRFGTTDAAKVKTISKSQLEERAVRNAYRAEKPTVARGACVLLLRFAQALSPAMQPEVEVGKRQADEG